MTTLAIILAVWLLIGIVIVVPGVTLIWVDYEIYGLTFSLVAKILLLGPFFWLCIVAILVLYLLDNLVNIRR
jgi:hypothetical protein